MDDSSLENEENQLFRHIRREIERRESRGKYSDLQLNPPLPEKDVIAFEAKSEITLPEGYRRFVTQIANGGVGIGACELVKLGEHLYKRGCLGHPFPHSAAWNDQSCIPEDLDPIHMDDPATLAEYDRRYEVFESDYLDDRHVDGAFPVAHLGCNSYLLLVVTGPERGHLWYDERADYHGIFPEQFRASGGDAARDRVTFLQWVNRQLLRNPTYW